MLLDNIYSKYILNTIFFPIYKYLPVIEAISKPLKPTPFTDIDTSHFYVWTPCFNPESFCLCIFFFNMFVVVVGGGGG